MRVDSPPKDHRPALFPGAKRESGPTFRLTFVLCSALLLNGCDLTLLFITSTVEAEAGEPITVVLELAADGATGGYLLGSRIPEGWIIGSATYSGTSEGSRVTGIGQPYSGDLLCQIDGEEPPLGYQDLRYSTQGGGFSTDPGEMFRITVSLWPSSAAGTFSVYFRVCGSSGDASNLVQASVRVLPSGAGLLLADDFESGGLSLWSTRLPLENGGFEAEDASWTSSSSSGVDLIVGPGAAPVAPFSGNWLAQLGTVDSEVSTLTHSEILLPVSPYWLSPRLWIDSTDPQCDPASDRLGLRVNDQELLNPPTPLCTTTSTGAWGTYSLDLRRWAGQWVTLEYFVVTDAADPSSVFLDEVALTTLPE